MRNPGALRPFLAALAIAVALAPAAVTATIDGVGDPGQGAQVDPGTIIGSPDPLSPGDNPAGGGTPPIAAPEPGASDGADPGFADGVRATFRDGFVYAGLATLTVAGLGLLGFGLVTRYISPKEALKNPQRAMLYGFVRGNPGVHLKKLSEEFHMKTSSILWHVRKLESAELVRSERSNGFRVFYPTAGGIEVRNLGRGVTALQNANAYQLFQALATMPGAVAGHLAQALGMHAGTARWHLKKLKEFNLVDEVPGPEGARYLPTPLGEKAFSSLSSAGHGPAAAPMAAPVA